jgi:hypothetical protein
VHGGEVIQNPQQTRKSFVVHYTSAADYKSRTARMRMRQNGNWQTVARTTETVIERNGARGLENPVRQAPTPGAEPARKAPDQQPAPVAAQFVQRAKRWTKQRVSRIRHR